MDFEGEARNHQEESMRILNLGGGVQSTTLYLMVLRGEIAPIDCAIFADLGEEPKSVYSHMEWLKSLGGPTIHVVSAGILGNDLMQGINSTGQRSASIPAFTAQNEGEPLGKIRRQCTSEYKILPIERFIRRTLLGLEKGQRIKTKLTQIFGISLDEAGRATRIKANSPHWSEPEFPLCDKMMTRADCVKWLETFGIPHTVPRSACVFCPYKSNHEWLLLRETDPDGWARAVEIDDALRVEGTVCNRNLNEKLYIHKSCRPLKEVHLTDGERGQSEFNLECEGGCAL
jgi:hypothetical protein